MIRHCRLGPVGDRRRCGTPVLPELPPVRPQPRPLAGELGAALPSTLAIPSIGVASPLSAVGGDASGVIVAPPAAEDGLAGWYAAGPTPGRPGAAVIVGGRVLARLRDLVRGDIVGVVRADDTVAVFRVTTAERLPEVPYPRARLLAPSDEPELRLLTTAHAVHVLVYATFTAAYALDDLALTAPDE
ncbi:sortase domain-bontaining protein [Actinomadura flavalba]|uniref:sortase domain-containing protein n=1 Tax=Actinomadura flavalba TaxID=1120938 RepID=UPI000376B5EE|nr:class F sortase [Actinomadura flavalba]